MIATVTIFKNLNKTGLNKFNKGMSVPICHMSERFRNWAFVIMVMGHKQLSVLLLLLMLLWLLFSLVKCDIISEIFPIVVSTS